MDPHFKQVEDNIVANSAAAFAALVAEKQRSAVTGNLAVERDGMALTLVTKARAASALGEMATGKAEPPGEFLKRWGFGDLAGAMTKSMSTNTVAGGGGLVHPQFVEDFIHYQRKLTVVRGSGAFEYPMPKGSLTFDIGSEGVEVTYGVVGEGGDVEDIIETRLATKQLTLVERKLSAFVVLPNDLIRNTGLRAVEIVREELARGIAEHEDRAFLYGSGTVYEPLGILNQIAAAHRYAMTALATAGTPTVLEAKRELNKTRKLLLDAKTAMRKPVYLFSPRTERAILDASDPGGEGLNSLEMEMMLKGTVRGQRYVATPQIPDDLNGNESEIAHIDMSDVVVGVSLDMRIEVFPNATYKTESAGVVSGVAADKTVVRAISKHDIGLLRGTSGARITGVTWGA